MKDRDMGTTMRVGIESIHAYMARARIDVATLLRARGHDLNRFASLMMQQKAVCMPFEDPVTHAVNAARPLLRALGRDAVSQVELLVVATESGVDFGKSLGTYVHEQLGLSRTCRLFEIKQACYAGAAALQTAAAFVATSLGQRRAKALVVATDVTHAIANFSFGEPSQGTGAVAMLVGNEPDVFELDVGQSGYHCYEVMDTCRPDVQLEIGDADLSVLSYLECLEHCFRTYAERTGRSDLRTEFEYLAFHTPYGGMVRAAHRSLMRPYRCPTSEVEKDFQARVAPSLRFCSEVGNMYSATLFLALLGILESAPIDTPRRVGMFAYGSGCASEFFSGRIGPRARSIVSAFEPASALASRRALSMDEYDRLQAPGAFLPFGARECDVDLEPFADIYDEQFRGRELLVFQGVESNYHRKYAYA